MGARTEREETPHTGQPGTGAHTEWTQGCVNCYGGETCDFFVVILFWAQWGEVYFWRLCLMTWTAGQFRKKYLVLTTSGMGAAIRGDVKAA